MAKKIAKTAGENTGVQTAEHRRALRKAKTLLQKQQWQESLPHLLKLWDALPEDVHILTLLAQALIHSGVRDKAIEVLERTLAIHGETPRILAVMGELAAGMAMPEIAAKLGYKLIELEPDNPERYVNLASALGDLERRDESINLLQQIIPIFPDDANLWNTLSIQVNARDGTEASLVFYEQALSLAPKDFRILANFGKALYMVGQYDRAFELMYKATKQNSEAAEAHLGVAKHFFYTGEMKKAFRHYEYRLDKKRSSMQVQHYLHKVPRWRGEKLSGKSLLVEAEQGIGDEIMWCSFLPYLYDRVDQLYIGCNNRLVSIFERRFPKAVVSGTADTILQGYRYRVFPKIHDMMKESAIKIDYAIPMGSCASYDWKSYEDIAPHEDGYLTPDPERFEEMKERLAKISDKPKVAIGWRSGLLQWDRLHHYPVIENLEGLFRYAGQVDFVNIQYGEVDEELKEIQDRFGVKVHNFEDIDLKMDIEANLALMKACDLCIAVTSAPAQFSLAVGTPTLVMSGPRLWWDFGQTGTALFAKDGEVFDSEGEINWNNTISRVATRMKERLSLS